MDRPEIERIAREMTSVMRNNNTSPAMAAKIETWRNDMCVAADVRIPR